MTLQTLRWCCSARCRPGGECDRYHFGSWSVHGGGPARAAEMERNLTRERTRSAMAVKRANGQRIGTVPYGSDLGNDGATLVPNQAEQSVIRDIRAMRSEGMTLEGIAHSLSERGIPTKTGRSRRWSHRSVASILDRGTPRSTVESALDAPPVSRDS